MNSLIEMRNITKRFPGVTALKGINFEVRPGEVHVLVGKNGAGKSTLMKILSGAMTLTEGSLLINGKEYSRFTPRISRENGISIIYQELSVINEISIQENIFAGRLLTKRIAGIPVVDKNRMRERTQEVLEEIGLHRDPSTPVGQLSISEKQMVEIAKAVAFDAKVIIMDEPTTSLTADEIRHLFEIIANLKKQGRGIIFISHKLDEVLTIGDRITVLMDGTYIGTYPVSDLEEETLARLMVGREVKDSYLKDPEKQYEDQVIFEVRNLTRRDEKVRNVSFSLKKGEILGFSGLVGAGRTELMEAVFGAEPLKQGEILLYGKEQTIRSPFDAVRSGIALVTENRRETGFSPYHSVRENLVQAKGIKEARFFGLSGMIHKKEEEELAGRQRQAMQIRCTSLDQVITELSGGNQQKVILGKWMVSDPEVIIFDEPTKGIDVVSRLEIYRWMRELAEAGKGVLVTSSEATELLSVCDRILVMRNGECKGEFRSVDVTKEELVRASF